MAMCVIAVAGVAPCQYSFYWLAKETLTPSAPFWVKGFQVSALRVKFPVFAAGEANWHLATASLY